MNKRMLCVLMIIVMVLLFAGCNSHKQEIDENTSVSEESVEEIVSEDTESAENETNQAEAPTEGVTVMEATDKVIVSEDVIAEEQQTETTTKTEDFLRAENGKILVDVIMFMGQSNMSGCGGDAAQAPAVKERAGYEFRAISDPTKLYPITEPFGINENQIGGIIEYPGGKKGSLVSSFVNAYYEETGVPVIAVSASAGATASEYWTRPAIVNDFVERHARVVVWLESNECSVRNQYVVWLQGESDADAGITAQQYSENMDNIIRPLFINGVQKVFIIRPGRTLDDEHFFDDIIQAQTEMSKDSDYYALASTLLAGFDTSYMVDQWHYCQTALNLLGEDAGRNVAYYTNQKKEACMYDYKYHNTYIPMGFDYPDDMEAEPILIEPLIKVDE